MVEVVINEIVFPAYLLIYLFSPALFHLSALGAGIVVASVGLIPWTTYDVDGIALVFQLGFLITGVVVVPAIYPNLEHRGVPLIMFLNAPLIMFLNGLDWIQTPFDTCLILPGEFLGILIPGDLHDVRV